MRRLAYYYYSSSGSSTYGVIIACVIVFFIIIIFLLAFMRRRKRLKMQQAQVQAQAQAQTQMGAMPSYPSPQYSTPYTPGAQGYPAPAGAPPGYPSGGVPPDGGGPTGYPPYGAPPPVGGAPAVWFNRSPSRADLEALNPQQLMDTGARMGLSDQAQLPRAEYIELILATQASLAAAASAPAPSFGASKLTSPGGGSFKNPTTGFMECGMCMDPMGSGAPGDKSAAVPPCGHVYCFDCLRRVAMEGNGACPTCRKVFFEFQITKIYT